MKALVKRSSIRLPSGEPVTQEHLRKIAAEQKWEVQEQPDGDIGVMVDMPDNLVDEAFPSARPSLTADMLKAAIGEFTPVTRQAPFSRAVQELGRSMRAPVMRPNKRVPFTPPNNKGRKGR